MNRCATEGCTSTSRWPRPRRRIGFCDSCLTRFASARSATMIRPGSDARARFRVRHEPCGAITDVSLPMLRKGWVCRMCTLGGLTTQGWVQGRGEWSLERQEQLMIVAGLRPLITLADNSPGTIRLTSSACSAAAHRPTRCLVSARASACRGCRAGSATPPDSSRPRMSSGPASKPFV